MIFEFTYGEKTYTVNVEEKGDSFLVAIDDRKYELDVNEVSPGCFSILKDGDSRRVFVADEEGVVHLDVGGMKFRLEELKEDSQEAAGSAGAGLGAGGKLLMPMPGKVIKVNVSDGDTVEAGQILVVIESMKMEQNIKTPVAGTVKKVHVTEGQQVDLEETLLEVDAVDEGAE